VSSDARLRFQSELHQRATVMTKRIQGRKKVYFRKQKRRKNINMSNDNKSQRLSGPETVACLLAINMHKSANPFLFTTNAYFAGSTSQYWSSVRTERKMRHWFWKNL